MDIHMIFTVNVFLRSSLYMRMYLCVQACMYMCVYDFNKLLHLGWTCLSTCAPDKTVLL